MRIVMCPLVSRDLYKSVRAVKTCLNQFPTNNLQIDVVPVINTMDSVFESEFVGWCEENKISYKITNSNGTAPKGKNSVLDFFLNSDYEGCSMFDGDDMWYPTAMRQVERHLTRHPGTDLLIVKPSDTVMGCQLENHVLVKENYWACLWGNNIFSLNYIYGPATNDIFTKGHQACVNLGGHTFYSKKLASKIRYDEDQLLGEDLLFELEALRLHQEGEITFWLSFASDVQLLDRTTSENIQSRLADQSTFYGLRIIERAKTILPIERSSFHELPVEFPPMLFYYQNKFDFIFENF